MDLGSKLGKIAGKATALLKETAQYKGEYEHMSIRLYKSLVMVQNVNYAELRLWQCYKKEDMI